jgi:predicted metal-binding membrane protein
LERTGRRLSGYAWIALLAIALLAWIVTAQQAAMMPMMMGVPPLSLFLVVWVVMMVAMMFPAVSPVVVTFDRWVRRTHRSRGATVVFMAGYLLVWTVSGLVVYSALVHLGPLLPSGENALRWGGGLLILAGGYQLTPLKQMCLRHCRSPLAFVAQHAVQLRRGRLGAGRVGVVHGMYCLGCCWALMLILILLGMMNLAWMAAVAAVIFVEKVFPRGPLVARIVALLLIAVGVALLVLPLGVSQRIGVSALHSCNDVTSQLNP